MAATPPALETANPNRLINLVMRRAREFLLWLILLAIGGIIYVASKTVGAGIFLCALRAAWPLVQSWPHPASI